MTATVLYRGLISGYPAQGRRLSGEEIDNALLVEGYCSKILLFSACGFPDNPPEEPAVHLIVRPQNAPMPESKPGCYVSLCVSSIKMNPDDIESHLGITPSRTSRKIVMGTPTGESFPAIHPYHLALFPSGLSSSDRIDVHIEHMVAVLEPLLPRLKAIEDRCKSVIQCTCVVRDEDGWELSPELLARMGRLGIAFCFALDERSKEKAV